MINYYWEIQDNLNSAFKLIYGEGSSRSAMKINIQNIAANNY